MDLTAFPPIAAVLDAAYTALCALVDALVPLAGSASAAAAIVLVTLLVRASLIPVAVSQRRAELTRARLVPRRRALQLKYASNPELLRRKTAELYLSENFSPLAGCLPLLIQGPVLAVVYGVFSFATINGHANALLAQTLFGVPLGQTLLHLIATGPFWPGVLVFAVLLATLAAVSWLSRRVVLRQQAAVDITPTMPAAGVTPRVLVLVGWLPFLTVAVAAVVPLAAGVYLAASTAWTFAERSTLRKLLT